MVLIPLLPVHHRHAADRQCHQPDHGLCRQPAGGHGLRLLLRLGLLPVVGEYPAGTPWLATAVINNGSALGMAIGLIASSLLVKSFNMNWQIMLFIITGLLVVMTLVFAVVIKGSQPQAPAAVSQTVAPTAAEPEEDGGPAACSACA